MRSSLHGWHFLLSRGSGQSVNPGWNEMRMRCHEMWVEKYHDSWLQVAHRNAAPYHGRGCLGLYLYCVRKPIPLLSKESST